MSTEVKNKFEVGITKIMYFLPRLSNKGTIQRRRKTEAELEAESSRGFPDLLLLSTTTSLVRITGFPTAKTHASSILSLLRLFTILPSENPPPPLSATI